MATSLTIATGALSATVTTNNDTAARESLLRFAHATGADPSWTNQQKMNHVAAQLREYIIKLGKERYVSEETETIRQAAETAITW